MTKLNYRTPDDRTLQAFEAATCDTKRDLWADKIPYPLGNGENSNVAAVRNELAFKCMEELRRYEREVRDNKRELRDD